MTFEITLSDRQERALALSLALLVLLTAATVGTAFATSWSEHRGRAIALADERAKYESLLRDAPALKRKIEELRVSPRESVAFVPSTSAPDMQAKVSGIVAGEGATPRHMSVELKTESDEAPVELRATVLFSADIAQLTRVLYRLRQARPYLFVIRLAVRGSEPSSSARHRLDVDLVAVSYVRAP